MKNKLFYLGFVVLFLFPKESFSHGVVSTVIEPSPRSFVVEAHYSDGEPRSYAKVTVKYLSDKIPFQSGFTDHNGYFALIPDREGEWTIIFEDGMAHRSELKVAVDFDTIRDKKAEDNESTSLGSLPRNIKIIIGLSMIFGLFGLSSLIMLRKRDYSKGK